MRGRWEESKGQVREEEERRVEGWEQRNVITLNMHQTQRGT